MRFLYLRDPLFLACVAAYFVNRFVLKNIWHDGFVHAHLNDLICIPFWVPIMLFAQRSLRLRADDHSPRPAEIIIALVVWSWVFEIILPATALFGDRCVADHLDVLYYALGALLASLFWKWWYPEPNPTRTAANLPPGNSPAPPVPSTVAPPRALHTPSPRPAATTPGTTPP
jgi:hypothetical protein